MNYFYLMFLKCCREVPMNVVELDEFICECFLYGLPEFKCCVVNEITQARDRENRGLMLITFCIMAAVFNEYAK